MMKTKMMKMVKGRGIKLFILASFVFLLAFVLPVSALHAAAAEDNLIPSDGKATLYNEFSPTAYQFETAPQSRGALQIAEKASDSMTRMLDLFLSVLIVIMAFLSRLFIWLSTEAYTFSYLDSLIDGVAEIVRQVSGVSGGWFGGNTLWGQIFTLCSSITVLYLIWLFLRMKWLETFQTIVTFILAMAISLTFLVNVGPFMKWMHTATNDIGSGIFTAMSSATRLNADQKDAASVIGNQIWEQTVMRPYKMLQFDDAAVSDADAKKILATAPFSDARNKALRDMVKQYPSIEQQRFGKQFVILLLSMFFNIVIVGFFSLLAFTLIFVQLKALIHAVAMAITLLASLLPGRSAGLSVIQGQFTKLIGLFVSVFVSGFFLSLALTVGNLTFTLVNAKSGWFPGMFLEAVMIIVVYKYRKEIGSVFTKASGGQVPVESPRSILKTVSNLNQAREMVAAGGQFAAKIFSKPIQDGVPNHFNPNSFGYAHQNVDDATTSSMMLRYQREKTASEEVAQQTGAPVQYSPFVAQVNDNLQTLAKNPFRGLDKEYKQGRERLQHVKDNNGDVRQAILSTGISPDMSEQEVAASMYSNESMIREASHFMAHRPKQALSQMRNAKSLNRDGKLVNAVHDYTMVRLFQRYKTEHMAAVTASAVSGEPVKQSDFVQRMDSKFRAAGLTNQQDINQRMESRKFRIKMSSHFEALPEFKNQKMKLLQSNEAFNRVQPAQVKQEAVRLTGPLNAMNMVKHIPVTTGNPLSSQERIPALAAESAAVRNAVPTPVVIRPLAALKSTPTFDSQTVAQNLASKEQPLEGGNPVSSGGSISMPNQRQVSTSGSGARNSSSGSIGASSTMPSESYLRNSPIVEESASSGSKGASLAMPTQSRTTNGSAATRSPSSNSTGGAFMIQSQPNRTNGGVSRKNPSLVPTDGDLSMPNPQSIVSTGGSAQMPNAVLPQAQKKKENLYTPKSVTFSNGSSQTIVEKRANLTESMEQGPAKVDASKEQEVAQNITRKISPALTQGLQDEFSYVKVMDHAKTAELSPKMESVKNELIKDVQAAREKRNNRKKTK